MKSPKVGIIIVNYNGEEDTIECLSSLSKIDYDNYEIVVVDNNSQDSSNLQNFCEANDIIFIKASANDGFSSGNNIGIKRALQDNVDFVLLLNNDTLVTPNFLSELLKCYCNNKSAGLVGGKIFFNSNKEYLWYAGGDISFSEGAITHWGYKKKDLDTDLAAKKVTFVTGCLMLIPVSTIEKVGLLDESYFLYGEDADYCCRVMNTGLDLYYCPNSVIFHKVSASSPNNASAQYYQTRNDFYLFDKFSPQSIKKKAIRKLVIRKFKEVISGVLQFKSFFKGYRDYRKNITGKNS